MVEKSAFQAAKHRKSKRRKVPDRIVTSDVTDITCRKVIEKALRAWLEASGCRRDHVNDHFNNPPELITKTYFDPPRSFSKPTGHDCCDRCGEASQKEVPTTSSQGSHSELTHGVTFNERDSSPDLPSPRSLLRAPLTPSRSRNTNGKRTLIVRSPSASPTRTRSRGTAAMTDPDEGSNGPQI